MHLAKDTWVSDNRYNNTCPIVHNTITKLYLILDLVLDATGLGIIGVLDQSTFLR